MREVLIEKCLGSQLYGRERLIQSLPSKAHKAMQSNVNHNYFFPEKKMSCLRRDLSLRHTGYHVDVLPTELPRQAQLGRPNL